MNKNTATLSAVVVATMLLSAMVIAAPTLSLSNLQLPGIFGRAFAAGEDNVVELKSVTLPNGQYAYEMESHMRGATELTSLYQDMGTIPGPTIIIEEGDTLEINVDGVVEGIEFDDDVADGSAAPGTYLYKGEEGALIGLFGAIIVRAADNTVQPYVAEGTGAITAATESDLDKEFLLFMVGSTFWGQEISDDEQTPLWTNPTLDADLGDIVQFHILSIANEHTFHLHAHRWVEPGTNAIIDTKLMEAPSDTHVFTVEAGADVGPGSWQYHCHVFAHMEAGMHGTFNVGSAPEPHHGPMGASPYNIHPVVADILDVPGPEGPGLVTFEITDEPGSWFRNTQDISSVTKTKSLALANPGDSVNFVMSQTNTVHTITSLLWPTGAEHFPMDEVTAYEGGGIVQMDLPGLYVFTCKVHPYMFGAVIVDDPETEIDPETHPDIPVAGPLLGTVVEDGDLLLDLGDTISLVNGLTIPTSSDLALRLTSTFWKATSPDNWKDYREDTYNPSYPEVSVLANGLAVINLDTLLDVYFQETAHEDITSQLNDPDTDGVGEVWVDTQFEHTEGKTKPGTATAVDTSTWEVTKKVALPEVNMNNPHNMWTDSEQSVIYQTEWFDNKLSIFDREDLDFIDQITVGDAPSHVMTRANNGDIHVALNGEEGVAEILAGDDEVNRIIPMQGLGQDPTHPHAHWMSADGELMVTPNSLTGDSSLYGFDDDEILAKTPTGVIPIATGMMPDSSKYYVANLLSNSLTCISMTDSPACVDDDGTTMVHTKTINLIEDYNPLPLMLYTDPFTPITGVTIGDGIFPLADVPEDGVIAVGALPIQTPVSPDGEYMVTANTLSGTITILDTDTDRVVTMLGCDPGCHGVQFGAKEGGGYYAYVSSKFSNAMVIVDMDTLTEAGRVLLVADSGADSDDDIVDDENIGMGGQGVLAIPNPYNGWIQATVNDFDDLSDEVQDWVCDLEPEQRDPNGSEAPNVDEIECT